MVIKFRIWCDERECFVTNPYFIDGKFYLTRSDFDNGVTAKNKAEQYTGLIDIWENDIIEDNVGIGYVEYVDKYAAFRVNYNNRRCKWFYDYLDSEMKSLVKIGNIHENPELLK